jgi:hypothetical protein
MAKTYTISTSLRAATPRSERLREAGYSGVSYSALVGASTATDATASTDAWGKTESDSRYLLATDERVAEWTAAATASHEHDNKTMLDAIDQELSTGSDVTFDDVNAQDVITSWIDGEQANNELNLRVGEGLNVMSAYYSGGSGFAVQFDDGEGSRPDAVRCTLPLVADKLTVNGSLYCTELVKNKVRATNGELYVTDSATVKTVYLIDATASVYVYFDELTFAVDDLVLMQHNDATGSFVKMLWLVAEIADDGLVRLIGSSGSCDSSLIEQGSYFVRVSSLSDPERQTGILLTPNEGAGIDLYTSYGLTSATVLTSLGRLDRLGIKGVTGYGLYTNNAYITGEINATKLTIEGSATVDNLTVRSLETASDGVRIIAHGHDLRMVDDAGETRLAINGDEMSSASAFASGGGSASETAIIATSQTYTESGKTSKTITDYIELATLDVPSSGSYELVLPALNGTISGEYTHTVGLTSSASSASLDVCYEVRDEDSGTTLYAADGEHLSVELDDETPSQDISLSAMRLAVSPGAKLSVGLAVTAAYRLKNAEDTVRWTVASLAPKTSAYLAEMSKATHIFANGLGYKHSSDRYAAIMATGESSTPILEVRAGLTILRVVDAGVQVSTDGGTNYKTL